jgi:hypothetical protein
MPKNFLGRDGLASDETVSEYYATGPYLVRVCWNHKYFTTPEKAVAELTGMIAAVPNPEIDPSGIEAKRIYEIETTIKAIRSHYGIKQEGNNNG